MKTVATIIALVLGSASMGAQAESNRISREVIRTALISNVTSASDSAASPHRAAARNLESSGFGWQVADKGALENYLDQLVRITDKSGQQHRGALRELNPGRLVIEHAALDGGGYSELSLVSVRELRVFGKSR